LEHVAPFGVLAEAATAAEETLEKGRELLSKIPFQYRPAVWGQIRALEGKLAAQWVPKRVPTLIIGSKYDCICPFSLFAKDERFHRQNIELLFIEDAGHCPWVENPTAVRQAFEELCERIDSMESLTKGEER
jgi:pimeloyl-ACP methyl ester carboxylesterase